ncbi:MAG: nucleotidyl transferase AbiEii/AbiGii toxin family protein [Candidatus Bathyarchaeia archaeon]
MRADFVNEVARVLKINRRDLLEKDIILHQILSDLSKDEFFAPNFLFKGGTCLIKCYFGYMRFSEDIDFTWKDQSAFGKMSGKKIRAQLSKIIDRTGSVFESIAKKRGLDFKCVKSNPDYVELGGGDKTCTLKIWYDSEILGRRSFVKVQINFVERMCFSPTKGQLSGLLTGKHEELKALSPDETAEYSKKILFGVYGIREILCEKVRALLTREGTKARDSLDVYLIWKRFGIRSEDEEKRIIDKIDFSLKLYAKYRDHLKQKVALLNSGKLFDWGAEKELLLSDIDEADFYKFLGGFEIFLKKIVAALGY